MVKLFNQTFISAKRKWIGSLATACLVVGALLLTLGPASANNDRDNGHTLHLIPRFNPPVATQGVAPPLPVGAQFTIGGTLSHPDRPNEQIGTIGIHFVTTL